MADAKTFQFMRLRLVFLISVTIPPQKYVPVGMALQEARTNG
jgi:hypothetical protein